MSGIDDDRPHEVGQLLDGLFRKKRRQPALTVNRLRQCWPGIVGEALARVTWPTRIARGVLWIAAIDTGWAFNLQFVKADLLNAVQTFLGSQDIQEIKYKAGPLPDRAVAVTEAPGSLTPSEGSASPDTERVTKRLPAGPESLPQTDPGETPIADRALRERFLRTSAKLKARRRAGGSGAAPRDAGKEGGS